ncbi:MAG: terminase small subunit [Alphaproteobacteria bacterium]
MSKRQKITTTNERQKVINASGKDIQPPDYFELSEQDLIHFENIAGEMAKVEITPHKLDVMALLARMITDFDNEVLAMRKEGSVIETEKGTVTNPRKALISFYANSITAFRRSLSIHGRGIGGDKRDIAKRRAIAKDIERDVSEVFDESGLIARPLLEEDY